MNAAAGTANSTRRLGEMPVGSGVSGILLAGGASTRFGGDKLFADVGGAPLLHRPLRALAEVCGEVVVVLAPDSSEPTLPRVTTPLHLVRDERRFEGPPLAPPGGARAAAGQP